MPLLRNSGDPKRAGQSRGGRYEKRYKEFSSKLNSLIQSCSRQHSALRKFRAQSDAHKSNLYHDHTPTTQMTTPGLPLPLPTISVKEPPSRKQKHVRRPWFNCFERYGTSASKKTNLVLTDSAIQMRILFVEAVHLRVFSWLLPRPSSSTRHRGAR